MSTATPTPGGRHPVNVGHLVMGLAFLCFTAGWALVQSDAVTGDDIRWLLPIPWLVAGAAGLAVTATHSVRRSRAAAPELPPDNDLDTLIDTQEQP